MGVVQRTNPIETMELNRTLAGMLAGLGLLAGSQAFAQPARLQVIHNCADAAASTVDVWLDNTLLLDNFAFRTATPFIDAPTGTPFVVGIAPSNSTSAAESIFTQEFTLAPGGSYIVVASGIVSGSGYSPAPGFSLEVFDGAREAAEGPGTDVLVLHGSTDAPTVDVYESAVVSTTVIDDLSYTDFAGYLELPTLDFALQVRTADNTAVVAGYAAPLATLGLQNAALTVLASGFLNPAVNSNGPAFGLFAALPSGGALVELPSVAVNVPTARVQVIHNSADAIADPVDVYINGALALDNFAFRTATPFIDLSAGGLDVIVGIAPGNSTSAADVIAEFTYALADNETYILVANGIVSGSGYNPATPFDIYVTGGRESAQGPGTDVLVFHGSTDAPTVQVAETAVLGGAVIVPPFSYGDLAGYLEVPTADFVLQVQLPDGTPVASFAAPLSTLNLEGAALTVLASGFLNPANNSNGAAFGLYVALPSGGALVALPVVQTPTGTARLQVIHNSADAAAAVVDVYLNGDLLLDNFAFRTATPFIDAPSGVDLEVAIAPGNSTSVAQAIATFEYNLEADETYIIVANGIVSGSGYNPAIPFDLYVSGGRESAQGPGTDVLVFHGSTDAPTVQVAETALLGGAVIVPPFSYGEFAGYLEVPTADFTLQVQLPDGTPVVAYSAPLATLGLENLALTVLASGFLDPAVNSNGAGFGLYVALPTGGPLVALPLSTGLNERDGLLNGLSVFPNPANEQLFIDLDARISTQASVRLTDISGRVVRAFEGQSIASGESRLVMNVNDLAAGTYQLSVVANDSVRSLPVQIVR